MKALGFSSIKNHSMKKLAYLLVLCLAIVSCASPKKEKAAEDTKKEAVVLTIDQLYEDAEKLVDKEVVLQGTVMHVCKNGGGRCFLMGSNEDIIIRVEAGEDIGAFKQEQMGSDLKITGIFTEVRTEADAHNPAKEHGEHAEGEEHNHEHDSEADKAHETIASAQETQEKVYFVRGMKAVEIK